MRTATVVGVLLVALQFGYAQNPPEVSLAVESVSPRAVEALTEHSLVRDYTAAWKDLAKASEENSPELLDGYFTGAAKNTLARKVSGQQAIGIHTRYLNQTHNLKAVFYAPEGDVIELQDAAEYQLQVVSDGKVLHDEHVVEQYLVLMTPAADRWMVRQIQAVPGP
jgi:hypothetical protein